VILSDGQSGLLENWDLETSELESEEELEEELDEPEVAEFIIIGLSLTMDADASQYES
jgi:hypothetical protein